MARFSTRSLRRPTPGRAAGGCLRGKTWDDMRSTPAAEVLEANVPRDVVTHFLTEHWRGLPRVLRPGRSHQSVLRLGARPYLHVFTFCEQGRVQGLLCTPDEARNFG